LAISEERSLGTAHEEPKNKARVINDGGHGDFCFDKSALFSYTNKGNCAHASTFLNKSCPDWLLDSGASKHVAGTSKEFCVLHPISTHT
jgi:hypothetical protein